MVSDLIAWLFEATLAGSAAILVVLVLRRWLLSAFGASAAHAAWVLVLVATCLLLARQQRRFLQARCVACSGSTR